ncbi:MAG: terminase small subunit [Eubacteriales bacterium]|nr:terminase small subunit [Eubacteriales bacterium]
MKALIQTALRTRKRKYDIQKLPIQIDGYFNAYLAANPEIVADTESLAAYIGITRDELNALEHHKKVGRCVSLAKTRIASVKKQLAYRGKINATLLAFDLKNDHGYREKPDDAQQMITIFKGEVLEWGS